MVATPRARRVCPRVSNELGMLAGLLIVLSPQHFALGSRARSQSLDARNFFGSLDRQFSVDKSALCRLVAEAATA